LGNCALIWFRAYIKGANYAFPGTSKKGCKSACHPLICSEQGGIGVPRREQRPVRGCLYMPAGVVRKGKRNGKEENLVGNTGNGAGIRNGSGWVQ